MRRQDQHDVLMAMARNAGRGVTFQDRMEAMAESLSVLVRSMSVSALVADLRVPTKPTKELAWFRNGDVSRLLEYGETLIRRDPMLPGARAAGGGAHLLSDFAEFGRDWFTAEFLSGLRVRHVMGTAHRLPDGSTLLFALQREPGTRDFSERERRLLRAASPDIARAALLPALKCRVTERAGPGPSAVVVLDGTGGVLHVDLGALTIGEDPAKLIETLAANSPRLRGGRRRAVHRELRVGTVAIRACFEPLDLRSGTGVVVSITPPPPQDASLAALAILDSADLTARERDLARLLVRGLTNREIGQRLGISEATVKWHLPHLFQAFGVRSRASFVAAILGCGEPGPSSESQEDRPPAE